MDFTTSLWELAGTRNLEIKPGASKRKRNWSQLRTNCSFTTCKCHKNLAWSGQLVPKCDYSMQPTSIIVICLASPCIWPISTKHDNCTPTAPLKVTYSKLVSISIFWVVKCVFFSKLSLDPADSPLRKTPLVNCISLVLIWYLIIIINGIFWEAVRWQYILFYFWVTGLIMSKGQLLSRFYLLLCIILKNRQHKVWLPDCVCLS